MQTPAYLDDRPGPLARTAAELVRLARLAAFRRAGRSGARSRLEQADALLAVVEECRVRGRTLLPSGAWMHVVRLLGAVDPLLRDELGINRHVDHVGGLLFAAQAQLMARSVAQRLTGEAQIIQLFDADGPLRVPVRLAGSSAAGD